MTDIKTLRPGILVALSTSVKGNRRYTRELIEALVDDSGAERERSEVLKVISDPAEYVAARQVRSKARNLIVRVCSVTASGHLLCPNDREPELKAAVAQARQLVDDFNQQASLTRMSINAYLGRVAQDDVQAVQAISTELRELMDDMETGLQALDVKQVRDACNQARQLGQMLSVDAKRQVDDVVQATRAAARKIVKAGETAAAEIDVELMAQIDKARTAFLDLDEGGSEVAQPDMPGLALDLDVAPQGEDEPAVAASAYVPIDIELGEALELERAGIDAELEAVMGVVRCPNCGNDAISGDAICMQCGQTEVK